LRWMMVHEGLGAPVGAGAVSVPTAAVEGSGE
jgi:hypothetical protein